MELCEQGRAGQVGTSALHDGSCRRAYRALPGPRKANRLRRFCVHPALAPCIISLSCSRASRTFKVRGTALATKTITVFSRHNRFAARLAITTSHKKWRTCYNAPASPPSRTAWSNTSSRAFLEFIPVFFGITFLTFLLLQVLPGDPVTAMMGEHTDPEVVARVSHQMHLDDPWPLRYVEYMWGALQGDLGESYKLNRPVAGLLLRRVSQDACPHRRRAHLCLDDRASPWASSRRCVPTRFPTIRPCSLRCSASLSPSFGRR